MTDPQPYLIHWTTAAALAVTASTAATYSAGTVESLVPGFARSCVGFHHRADYYRLAVVPLDVLDDDQGVPMLAVFPCDQGYVCALARDLADGAIMPPIVVTVGAGGRFVWEDGQHRIAAHHALGHTHVAAFVRVPYAPATAGSVAA